MGPGRVAKTNGHMQPITWAQYIADCACQFRDTISFPQTTGCALEDVALNHLKDFSLSLYTYIAHEGVSLSSSSTDRQSRISFPL
jgi:hypothetical protein